MGGSEVDTLEVADAVGDVETPGSVVEPLSDAMAELVGFGSTELTGELEGVKMPDDVRSPEAVDAPELVGVTEGVGETVFVTLSEGEGVPEAIAELDLTGVLDAEGVCEIIGELE
ncbi:hypothetical protein BBP40_001023 [Aspergillus hancockii]|nr:hypothetical protein BBP40_001023 [Aspergillus hancockii]